jgi:Tfp pilus assembly protein PilO
MGQRIKSLTVSEEELKALEQQIKGIQGEISQIERRIYPKTQLPQIARQIRQRGRIYNLHFRAMIPSYEALLPMGEVQTEEGQSPLIKLPMEFRLEGRYLNFGRFVEKADQYPFIFNLTDVDINFNKDIYPRLDIRMLGYLYLHEEDSEKSLSHR